MKKILIISVLSFLLLFPAKLLFSQDGDYSDKDRHVFWFNVSLHEYKQNGRKNLKVTKNGTRIFGGTLSEYDRYLWDGLSRGTRVAIGPFDTREGAEFAQRFYNTKNVKNDTVVQNNNQTQYYYLVKPRRLKRLKAWEFENMPAAVVGGNPQSCIQLMEVSLPQKKLVIGPFPTKMEAEESKRIFRLEE